MTSEEFRRVKEDFIRRQGGGGTNNPVAVLVVAIIIIIVGVLLNNGAQAFLGSAYTTKGVLHYEKNFSKSTAEKTYYDVYVKYTVDGKEYNERLKGAEYGGNFRIITGEGKEVTIYYNPNNPREIRDKDSNIIGKAMIGIGAFLAILAIGDIIYSKAKGRKIDDTSANDNASEKFANRMEDFLNKTGIINDDKNGKI